MSSFVSRIGIRSTAPRLFGTHIPARQGKAGVDGNLFFRLQPFLVRQLFFATCFLRVMAPQPAILQRASPVEATRPHDMKEKRLKRLLYLLTALHRTGKFAVHLPSGNGLPLVIELFTSRQSNFCFRFIAFDIHFRYYEGQAFFRHFTRQRYYLFTMQNNLRGRIGSWLI